MNREEKINTLRTIIQECEEYQWQRKETLFEIIKDLEQELVLDKIRAEIDSHCSDNRDRNDGLYIAMRIIDKYQASMTVAEGSEK